MSDLRWIDFSERPLEVNGLAWFGENGGEVWRLPGRLKGVVREAVWNLALHPSGARVRFASDTKSLSIRAEYDEAEFARNQGKISWGGFALYADGVHWRTAMPAEAGRADIQFFEDVPRKLREYSIHLPAFYAPKAMALAVDADAKVLPPAPFAVAKPVVFYGTSITQGASASHAGQAYEAVLGRILNVDTVNLGFAGNGLGEPEMARAVAEIDASCFVVDFSQNSPTPDHLRERYGPFIDCIRAAQPDVPIVCVTPIFAAKEIWTATWAYDNPAMSEVIRFAVAERMGRGNRRLILVEGHMLISDADRDPFADGLHPNDIGFRLMAERLAPVLRTALTLDAPRVAGGNA